MINIFGILRLILLWFRNTITTTKFEIIPTDAIEIERAIIMSTLCENSVSGVEVTLLFVAFSDVKSMVFEVDSAMTVVSEASNPFSIIRYWKSDNLLPDCFCCAAWYFIQLSTLELWMPLNGVKVSNYCAYTFVEDGLCFTRISPEPLSCLKVYHLL